MTLRETRNKILNILKDAKERNIFDADIQDKFDEVIFKLQELKEDKAEEILEINAPMNVLYGVFGDREIS